MQTYFDFSFRCYAVLIQEQLKELHNASNVRCQQFRIKLGGRQSVMLIQKSTTKKRQKSNKFSILTCSLVASISWVLRAVSSGATIWWTWIQQNDNNYTQMQRAIWKIVWHDHLPVSELHLERPATVLHSMYLPHLSNGKI